MKYKYKVCVDNLDDGNSYWFQDGKGNFQLWLKEKLGEHNG